MKHEEHIKEFRAICKAHGWNLSEEEAAKEFFRLLAFMRLLLHFEAKERNKRYRDLFEKQIADIINS